MRRKVQKIFMEWTKAQREVIETRNKNILVSAAAGSGKTAVLIERIKQLVINDRVDIDRFLITTFTNAASLEMKSRLEKAIREEMNKTDADLEFLKKQLELMQRANISTFHTFALEVMKRYFYFTDLEPGFRIGDETEISIMKEEAVRQLFEKRFYEDYDAFTRFLKKYSSDRNENRIKKNIIELYDEMRSIPGYMEWAEKKNELLMDDSPSEALGLIDIISEETESELKKAFRFYSDAAEILENAGLEGIEEKARKDAGMILDMIETAEKENDQKERLSIYGRFLNNISFNQMRATKEQQEDYEEVKEHVTRLRKKGRKILDDIKKKYYQRSLADYDAELNQVYSDTKYMTGLIKEFEEIFRQKKAEKDMVDFDDVMHYAIEILQDDMVSLEYREKFLYIFIDEFQDSNLLQEAIVKRISRSNNLFMVGDIKQSIYRFRLADPEIFREKYIMYGKECEKSSVKIDLNSNFRSKKLVTDTVNRVFENIMEDYDDNARLRCTIGGGHYGFDTQCHIVKTGSDRSEIYEDTKPEEEMILQLVRESLGQEIYDVKKDIMRKVEYRDIVILSRNRSSVAAVERFLNNEGIPAYGENAGGYFETVEIQVFVNLLKIIDNTRQDIPLISVMRCPVFDFDAKELAAIRIEYKDGSFYDAVKHYMEDGSILSLKEKLTNMEKKLAYWKELKNTVTLEELIRTLMYDTGYFDYCSGLPVGRQRISNLRLLVEKASQFEQHDYSGLYGFISYIEAMKKSNIMVGEAKTLGENDNVIRVMTVHKSKGLEFPVVIIAGMGRLIRHKGTGNSTIMHKDMALAMTFVNIDEMWHRKTLLQRVIESLKAREEYEEEIRILYVAMTRAMDRLILVGSVKDEKKLEDITGSGSSYLEMIYPSMHGSEGYVHMHDIHDGWEYDGKNHSGTADVSYIFEKNVTDSDGYDIKMKEIDRKLSYIYPMEDITQIRSKYSVTELNRWQNPSEIESYHVKKLPRPDFISGKKIYDPAKAGTIMHLVMEKLDFKETFKEGNRYIKRIIDFLCDNGTLTDEEKKMINISQIESFFTQDPGIRAASAEVLYKEREFILEKNIGGADVIVQGIIDCYFEEEDGIILIDYKNSHIKDENDSIDIIDRYAGQMKIYREALEKASDKKVKESYLYLFEIKKFIPVKI